MRWGMHLPNREMSQAEWAVICKLGLLDVVDLDLWPDRWDWLGTIAPRRSLNVRLSGRGSFASLAAEVGHFVILYYRYGGVVKTWRPRNECNIESLGSPLGDYLGYLWGFADLARAQVGDVPIWTPAVSPGAPGWLDWDKTTSDAARLGRYKGRDAHVYGDADEVEATLQAIRHTWDGPLMVTEWNYGAGRAVSPKDWAAMIPRVAQVFNKFKVETACVFIWEWVNPDMALPTPVNVKDTILAPALYDAQTDELYQDFESPNHGPQRASTEGIVVHGTGGLSADLLVEWRASWRWHYESRGVQAVSSHAIAGPGTRIKRPVRVEDEAWHCRSWNASHLGLELTQAPDGKVTTDIMRTGAREAARWAVKYKVPILHARRGFLEHRETDPGIASGNQDVGHGFDMSAFLQMVREEAWRLAPHPLLNVGELRAFPDWAMGRLGNKQDFRGAAGLADFQTHLKLLGCAYTTPWRYGHPMLPA